MALVDDIKTEVGTIISTPWKTTKGTKFPATENVTLSGGAVELDATYLYSDLAGSSKIAKELDRRIAAKILKAFLATTVRVIRDRGGQIVSFDGDRVLGVFVGDSKNSQAAKCALNIEYVVGKIIKPKFESKYSSISENGIDISQGTGVDTGSVLVVRAGARGNNDLISIGRAPNLAAKMSELRTGNYSSYISASVYNRLNNSSKYAGDPPQDMWEKRYWQFLDESIVIYRSSWHWKPS